MSQQRKVRRKSELSKVEESSLKNNKNKNSESWATRISKIAIIIVFAAMVISLAYTVVLLSSSM